MSEIAKRVWNSRPLVPASCGKCWAAVDAGFAALMDEWQGGCLTSVSSVPRWSVRLGRMLCSPLALECVQDAFGARQATQGLARVATESVMEGGSRRWSEGAPRPLPPCYSTFVCCIVSVYDSRRDAARHGRGSASLMKNS